jgi:putative transposase
MPQAGIRLMTRMIATLLPMFSVSSGSPLTQVHTSFFLTVNAWPSRCIRISQGRGHHALSARPANELWCADYKGEFMLADRRYCYPLTITDFASRYLIACEALHTTKEAYAESIFKEFGLPRAIRTDNGVPLASPNALFGLSRLSVWWLRLGIEIERIKPGNPQQNGRHERMHLTLKLEASKPAAKNFLQQLRRSTCSVPRSSTCRHCGPIADCQTSTIPSTTRPSL